MSVVVRWVFVDTVTSESVALPLNPNAMTSPSFSRNLSWAWGSKWGTDRMRGIDAPPSSAPEWTFSGVILTKSHYDLLLAWAGRLNILTVTDHLGRTFRVLISKFDPVERLPTPLRSWRADYTMTCQLLEEIT